MKILLAEDDSIQRLVIKKFLDDDIYCASNGKEALEMIRHEKNFFDLLITDIMMPKMTGLELILKLPRRIPTIIISAVEPNLIPEDVKERTDYILSKPLDISKLKEIIKDINR